MEEQISMKHKFVGKNYLRSCEEHKFIINSSDCKQLFTLHQKLIRSVIIVYLIKSSEVYNAIEGVVKLKTWFSIASMAHEVLITVQASVFRCCYFEVWYGIYQPLEGEIPPCRVSVSRALKEPHKRLSMVFFTACRLWRLITFPLFIELLFL